MMVLQKFWARHSNRAPALGAHTKLRDARSTYRGCERPQIVIKEPESSATKFFTNRDFCVASWDGNACDGDGSRGLRFEHRMRSGLLSGARRLLLALEGLLEHSGRRRGRYLFLHRSGGEVHCQVCDPWTLTIIVFLTGFITFTPSIVDYPTPLMTVSTTHA